MTRQPPTPAQATVFLELTDEEAAELLYTLPSEAKELRRLSRDLHPVEDADMIREWLEGAAVLDAVALKLAGKRGRR